MGIYYGFPRLNVLKVFIRISTQQSSIYVYTNKHLGDIYNLHSIFDKSKVHSLQMNLFVSKSLISLIAVSLRADSGACADIQGRGLQDMRLRGQQYQVPRLLDLVDRSKPCS